jgi:hypothetical protein
MEEQDRRFLIRVKSIKYADGSIGGPYSQCWANTVAGNLYLSPGARLRIELYGSRDVTVRVLTAYRPPPPMPGGSVIPEIEAQEVVDVSVRIP